MPTASADHGDPQNGGFSAPEHGTGLMVTAGPLIEFEQTAQTPQLLIGVAYRGINTTTGDHHIYRQRFRVSFQSVINPVATGSDVLSAFQFNIVPESQIETTHDGTTTSRRFVPMEARRNLGSELNGNVTVRAYGWSIQSEVPLFGRYNENQVAALTRFAQIVVDVIGLQYANIGRNEHFFGGDLGYVQALGGLGINAGKHFSVRIALGGRANIAFGGNVTTDQFMAMGETDFFNRLEFLLNTAWLRISLYLDVGIHSFQNLRFGEMNASDGHTHDHGDTENNSIHSHGFLFLGLNVAF